MSYRHGLREQNERTHGPSKYQNYSSSYLTLFSPASLHHQGNQHMARYSYHYNIQLSLELEEIHNPHVATLLRFMFSHDPINPQKTNVSKEAF